MVVRRALVLPHLLEVELGVRLELFDAGLAAELDLLTVVDTHDGVTHRAELAVHDDTRVERVWDDVRRLLGRDAREENERERKQELGHGREDELEHDSTVS